MLVSFLVVIPSCLVVSPDSSAVCHACSGTTMNTQRQMSHEWPSLILALITPRNKPQPLMQRPLACWLMYV